jgi:hypothetical protein
MVVFGWQKGKGIGIKHPDINSASPVNPPKGPTRSVDNLAIIEELLKNYYYAIRSLAIYEQCGTLLEIESTRKDIAIIRGKIMEFFYKGGYDKNK